MSCIWNVALVMANSKVTVVISQGQGRNPVRRQLEEDIATILLTEPGGYRLNP